MTDREHRSSNAVATKLRALCNSYAGNYDIRRLAGEGADEIDRLTAALAEAQKRIRSYESWERSINESLNSGDGSYRP